MAGRFFFGRGQSCFSLDGTSSRPVSDFHAKGSQTNLSWHPVQSNRFVGAESPHQQLPGQASAGGLRSTPGRALADFRRLWIAFSRLWTGFLIVFLVDGESKEDSIFSTNLHSKIHRHSAGLSGVAPLLRQPTRLSCWCSGNEGMTPINHPHCLFSGLPQVYSLCVWFSEPRPARLARVFLGWRRWLAREASA